MVPDGGSKNLDIILLAVVEPDVVIDPNDKPVVDVIGSCFPDNAELIRFCVYVSDIV